MKNQTLKEKLRNRENTIGSWITIGHQAIIDILAEAGFDWLTIDLEHTAIDLNELQVLIGFIQSHGMAALVPPAAHLDAHRTCSCPAGLRFRPCRSLLLPQLSWKAPSFPLSSSQLHQAVLPSPTWSCTRSSRASLMLLLPSSPRL